MPPDPNTNIRPYLSNHDYSCGTLQPVLDVLYYLPLTRQVDSIPKFSAYDDRLRSFKNKEHKFTRPVTELAEAGFYFCGLRDQIRCYHCNIGIQDLGDRHTWDMHIYLSPHCSHVLEMYGQPFTIKPKKVESPFFKKQEITDHRRADFYVAVKFFFEESCRRESFRQLQNHFPKYLLDEFIESGYFYTGLGHTCRCAVCNRNEQVVRWKKPSLCHEQWCNNLNWQDQMRSTAQGV